MSQGRPMTKTGTTISGINMSSIGLLLPLGLESSLHCGKLRVDCLVGLQFSNFFLKAPGPCHSKSIGAPLSKVSSALEDLELGEGILCPVAVQQLAGAGARDRAFQTRCNRIL